MVCAMTHLGRRAALSGLALLGLAGAVDAQPAARPEGVAQGGAAAPRALVLFLLPEADESAQHELRDALLAQFALLDAEIAFESAGGSTESLAQRMTHAQRRARERGALAVFWIDAQADGRWFVHLMDSELERVVVRPVDAAGDRRSAAIEAVAVMTRQSARALLEGAPLPETGPASDPLATPAPAPEPAHDPAPPARLLRLAGAYALSDIASSLPLRQGVAFAIDWFGFAPLYAGAAYTFTPEVAVDAVVDFDLQPIPVAVRAGYRSTLGRAAFDVELGLLLEFLRASLRREDPASRVEPVDRGSRTLVALSPRLRAEFGAWPKLSLFGSVGADILLNNLEYIAEDDRSGTRHVRTLLRGSDVRPAMELGIAFYP
jgi:hypothetical protein